VIDGTGTSAANHITGNSAANTLIGHGGGDTILGGTGDDRIFGGRGNDSLRGEGGTDRFYFDSALNASTNVDNLINFTPADDWILLDQDIFSGIAANGVLSASAFRLGTTALDADDRILYDQPTGQVFYDADGVGGVAAILFATVNDGTAVTNADFYVYG
jgi:Ca2+-binding RTX toxin-like protein